ncbi:hypothetical protein J5N97_016302 [Dioscorea zingiberensis]|uniref:Uncharacterized protein n=1 Tax=Dioscorea zingiberensis TaxID=325984 RepID=A0A9D5CKS1_9LILI|nr:hypothetical protein J5N97_016302 [Dioscorea zingiberensis]
MPVVCAKGRLMLVRRVEEDLVIAGPQVKLGEDSRAKQLIKEFIHRWNGEHILNSDRVQCPIIGAKAPGPIVLSHQENGRGKGTSTGLYQTLLKHVVDHLLYLRFLAMCVVVGLHLDRSGVWQQRNAVVSWPEGRQPRGERKNFLCPQPGCTKDDVGSGHWEKVSRKGQGVSLHLNVHVFNQTLDVEVGSVAHKDSEWLDGAHTQLEEAGEARLDKVIITAAVEKDYDRVS